MKFLIAVVLTACFGLGIPQSEAREIIALDPQETTIIGSIPYSVIGHYRAQFGAFKGRIVLDDAQQLESVYLEIQARSIRSNCPWCDQMARSRRLLNTRRYPKIIFRSDQIIHDQSGYQVKGVLEMHGIRRRLIFPFKFRMMNDQYTKTALIDLKGSWIINRKDFNIVWNKYLDHGGVVVGDDFTVNWGIKSALLKK